LNASVETLPVLIVGAGSDIGRAIAIAYAKAKRRLFLTARQPERLERDHGLVWRTTQDTYLKVGGKYVPDALSKLPFFAQLGKWFPSLQNVYPLWLPILVLFLSIAGLITHRHLIKFFRYFIVVAFIISAVLTPPDPMSQILMAVPLIGLYGVSIGVAWFITKGRERSKAKVEEDEKKDDQNEGGE